MIKLGFSVLCRTPIIDKRTNNLSLIDVTEQFNIPQFPVVIRGFSLIGCWFSDQGDDWESEDPIEVRFTVVRPNGKKRHSPPAELRLDAPHQRIFIDVSGTELLEPGAHEIHLSQRPSGGRWKKVAEIPLKVKRVELTDSPEVEKVR